jgi:transcription initiation factor IIE alpha subunit
MSGTLPYETKSKTTTKKQIIRMMLDKGENSDEEIARLDGILPLEYGI